MTYGSKYERELRDKLEDERYLVLRAAGSQGDAGDLAAIPPIKRRDIVYVFEVKSTRKDVYYTSQNKEQYEKMKEIGENYDCLPLYAVRFIDDSNEKIWKIYYIDDGDIYRKGEGIRFEDYF